MNASKLTLAVLLVLGTLSAQAKELALLAASAADQVPSRLVVAKAVPSAALERAPVEFSWALDPAAALAATAPYVAESREYWTEVEGTALATGVSLATTAPGAVVRVSPRAGNAAPALGRSDVVVRQNGRTLRGRDALADGDVAADFAEAGMPMPERTLAFRLRDEVGAGGFELALPEARGGYLVHVFEPASADVLSLTTNRTSVVAGGEIEIVARFASPAGRALGRIEGLATSPAGDAIELAFAPRGNGIWSARFTPAATSGGGLWEVHAFAASGDGSVARDAKIAFGAAAASARVIGGERTGSPRAPIVRVDVEVASGSRYVVSGVLYATDGNGARVPAAIAHSAAVLNSGRRSLQLRFATDAIDANGLSGPYEVRDLVLTNQADLGVIEQRARAFAFD